MTIKERFNKAKIEASSKQIDDMSIRMLLEEVLDFESQSDLLLHFDDEMTNETEFDACFQRLLAGEPVQYILSHASFLGNEFFVDKRVLIPREETEELVSIVIDELEEYRIDKSFTIVDIGTGSGIIAISLKKRFPLAHVIASDISNDALEVCSLNAMLLDADIKVLQGDMLNPLIKEGIKADVIISNPPYIENRSDIDKIVYDNEPLSALIASPGYKYYEIILKNASKVLKNNPHILLFFEINYDQSDIINKLVKEYLPTYDVEIFKDMQGKERIAKVFKRVS